MKTRRRTSTGDLAAGSRGKCSQWSKLLKPASNTSFSLSIVGGEFLLSDPWHLLYQCPRRLTRALSETRPVTVKSHRVLNYGSCGERLGDIAHLDRQASTPSQANEISSSLQMADAPQSRQRYIMLLCLTKEPDSRAHHRSSRKVDVEPCREGSAACCG